jgi:hypothetical protein
MIVWWSRLSRRWERISDGFFNRAAQSDIPQRAALASRAIDKAASWTLKAASATLGNCWNSRFGRWVCSCLRHFNKIVRLRNALVHRGFIRETDKVTHYIFGALSVGAMHTAMFEVMEDTQDALREYMLRLLGYRGHYCSYSNSGMSHKTIS